MKVKNIVTSNDKIWKKYNKLWTKYRAFVLEICSVLVGFNNRGLKEKWMLCQITVSSCYPCWVWENFEDFNDSLVIKSGRTGSNDVRIHKGRDCWNQGQQMWASVCHWPVVPLMGGDF